MFAKASELRKEIERLEQALGDKRPPLDPVATVEEPRGLSLKNKQVLVVGANGRLGSMVCRHLLRTHPECQVVAAVHYVGEDSPTARGYGRLSYEVGAEDGIGNIGPAWSAEDRIATFRYNPETMKGYNLQNLRIVDVELLDPVRCQTITENVDAVIWCASDFNGNTPRAVSGLNLAFLFRALADPTKPRVEIEGLRNILEGLKANLQDKEWKNNGGIESVLSRKPSISNKKGPTNFVLVSPAPEAFDNFETPYGEFNAIKRQGEDILSQEFPSLTHTILQMARFEDNFVDEGLDVLYGSVGDEKPRERRIHRRDAARAAVEALTDENLQGKTVPVWTSLQWKRIV
jgi:hypothetical protein